jgi:hypothetical protein
MSVYQYVADSDPRGTQRLIESFGYEITNQKNLGRSLSELVSNVGEPALKKVIELHPDKDIILEFNAIAMPTTTSCGCSSCKAKGGHEKYMNMSGNETTESGAKVSTNDTNILAHQTNTILVIATLVIVASLMFKK